MRGCWLLLALCIACDGIGDPVVGTKRKSPQTDFMCEPPPTDCDTAFAPQSVSRPQPVQPARLCGRELSTESCRDALQGGGCVLTLQVVEASPVTLPIQSCGTIDLTPAPGSSRLELRTLVARTSRLVLHAERPTTFLFSQVDLSGVAIELSGPIALELDGSLRDVSITSADEVQVTVTGTPATQLALSIPAGSVRIQRSTLTTSQLEAREVQLETIPFSDLDVTAQRLIGIELQGSRLRLGVDDLSLSEVAANELQLHRCERALLVNTRLNAPLLAACSDLLRAHSSAFVGGRAHGSIESIASYWGLMHFGAGRAQTNVALWAGTVTTSVLCPDLARLTISQSTSVTCNDCTRMDAPEQHICLVTAASDRFDPDGGIVVAGNDECPLLDQGLPRCDPMPLPTSPL
jgi:hypothetical protein